MDDIHDRRIEMSRLESRVCTNVDILDGLSQVLRILDIDCHELEDPVLGDDTHDQGTESLIVVVDDGDPSCPRVYHPPTGFV